MHEWDPLLETGIEEIDAYHKKLFQSIAALHEATRTPHSRYDAREFLEFLEAHLDDHFRAEEVVMLSEKYPGYFEHRAAHDEFRNRFHHFLVRYKYKGYAASIILETSEFAQEWLKSHVMTTDYELAKFLKAKKEPSSG